MALIQLTRVKSNKRCRQCKYYSSFTPHSRAAWCPGAASSDPKALQNNWKIDSSVCLQIHQEFTLEKENDSAYRTEWMIMMMDMKDCLQTISIFAILNKHTGHILRGHIQYTCCKMSKIELEF